MSRKTALRHLERVRATRNRTRRRRARRVIAIVMASDPERAQRVRDNFVGMIASGKVK